MAYIRRLKSIFVTLTMLFVEFFGFGAHIGPKYFICLGFDFSKAIDLFDMPQDNTFIHFYRLISTAIIMQNNLTE